MRFISRPTSTVQAATRKDDAARRTRQTILALAATSAVTLCSLAIANADTWITVNPDGSVTRTETTASAVQRDNDNRDRYPDEAENDERATRARSGTGWPIFS